MLAAIVVYFALQLGIAFWVSRWIRSETDFFVAGRGLPTWVCAGSLFATWFGAETVMGSSGAVAEKGLSGSRADPFGYTICLLLLAALLAWRLRAGGYVTLIDFYKHRFSRAVEILAVLVIVPTSLMWAAAQISALGQILVVITGADLSAALVAATVAIIVYTLIGGMWSDVVTDLVQGAVIAVGLALLLGCVFASAGGVSAGISRVTPEQLSFVAPGETLLGRLDAWMIPILGSLVALESSSRILAARTPETARRASVVASLIYLAVGLIPVLIALVGTHLPLQLEHRDQFIPSLARQVMPPVAYTVLVAALVSAIVSTINSTLLAVSSGLTHNLLFPLAPGLAEGRKILLARGGVVVAGVGACLIARSGESIYELVQMASSLGTSGLLVTVVAGMYFKRGGAWAAGASLLAGVASNVVTGTVVETQAPFLVSVAAALGAYLIFIPFDLRTQRKNGAPASAVTTPIGG